MTGAKALTTGLISGNILLGLMWYEVVTSINRLNTWLPADWAGWILLTGLTIFLSVIIVGLTIVAIFAWLS